MVNFELSNDGAPPVSHHPDRLAFAPPSNAMRCRQAVYSAVVASGDAVLLRDLARDLEFRSATVYRAAKKLVTSGILARRNVVSHPYGTALRPLIALAYVQPFEPSSRKWQ